MLLLSARANNHSGTSAAQQRVSCTSIKRGIKDGIGLNHLAVPETDAGLQDIALDDATAAFHTQYRTLAAFHV